MHFHSAFAVASELHASVLASHSQISKKLKNAFGTYRLTRQSNRRSESRSPEQAESRDHSLAMSHCRTVQIWVHMHRLEIQKITTAENEKGAP